MGGGTLSAEPDGVAEAELCRLRRVAARLLAGSPTRPYGTSPRRRRAGRGLEFLELHGWAPGDEPRDVDWRATARAGRPVVRRHQDEAFSTVLLAVDASASMAADAAKWACARRLAAALAYLLVDAGHRVGLVAFSAGVDAVVPPARGRTAHARLVARLARLVPRPAGGGSCLEACVRLVRPGTSVIVLSDFLAPDHLAGGLARLLHRGARVQAFQILSDADVTAGGDARVVLCDVESGSRRAVRLSAAVRAAAAARLEALCEDLAAWCRRRGVPLTRCAATTPWRAAILAHVQAAGGRHA
jgi:uncharacterized protein (DUF58 family)